MHEVYPIGHFQTKNQVLEKLNSHHLSYSTYFVRSKDGEHTNALHLLLIRTQQLVYHPDNSRLEDQPQRDERDRVKKGANYPDGKIQFPFFVNSHDKQPS